MQPGDIYKEGNLVGSFVCEDKKYPDQVVTEIIEGVSGWRRSSPVPEDYVAKYADKYWYMFKRSLVTQLNNYQIY